MSNSTKKSSSVNNKRGAPRSERVACPVCKRSFAKRAHLLTHQRIGTKCDPQHALDDDENQQYQKQKKIAAREEALKELEEQDILKRKNNNHQVLEDFPNSSVADEEEDYGTFAAGLTEKNNNVSVASGVPLADDIAADEKEDNGAFAAGLTENNNNVSVASGIPLADDIASDDNHKEAIITENDENAGVVTEFSLRRRNAISVLSPLVDNTTDDEQEGEVVVLTGGSGGSTGDHHYTSVGLHADRMSGLLGGVGSTVFATTSDSKEEEGIIDFTRRNSAPAPTAIDAEFSRTSSASRSPEYSRSSRCAHISQPGTFVTLADENRDALVDNLIRASNSSARSSSRTNNNNE